MRLRFSSSISIFETCFFHFCIEKKHWKTSDCEQNDLISISMSFSFITWKTSIFFYLLFFPIVCSCSFMFRFLSLVSPPSFPFSNFSDCLSRQDLKRGVFANFRKGEEKKKGGGGFPSGGFYGITCEVFYDCYSKWERVREKNEE